ncbi:hypothetical protein D3C75_1122740 [compost metagenome]
MVREVHVIEGVERVLQLVETFVETDFGQVLVADAHLGFAPGLAHAQAHFTAVADLPAYVQAKTVALQAILGDGVVVQGGFDVLRAQVQVWRDEVA